MHLILKQRAEIVRDASYEQMLAQIALLQQVTDWGEWQRAQEIAQELQEQQEYRRREGIDQRTALEQEVLGRPTLAARPRGIRVVPMKGLRLAQKKLLTEDDLYLDDARHMWINRPRIDQTCNLCHNLKSHPVS
jgi:hypothetical protein